MLLEAKNVVVSFKKENQAKLFGRERQTILHGLDLSLEKGECLGIIGESGSGKSTFGRVLSGLLKPDSGSVRLNGMEIYARHSHAERLALSHKTSIVFQDYTTSVNPRFRVKHILGESFRALRLAGERISKKEEYTTACSILERVGLPADFMERYPHELSGGQLQRVCIARAVAIRPEIVLLDEAISSLDAATQIQVMDLLKDLRRDSGLSYVFITHDLTAITYFCDKVHFMHNGRIVETVEDISRISEIKNSYAQDLLHAVVGIGIDHDNDEYARILEQRSETDAEALGPHGTGAHAAAQVSF
ncbi:ABC transporter ATP-binding protein [Sutterella sp.]|uniref:ABC transporter ATP-binding protein n=1 Tax=Sutterella sp. TaxID=1981025 RepID=UPI0026E0372F|nr:dipeptide/oligopeptide/nickel ABC transporter ATP-binding protein [Sutterella sp.]MDO5532491.1 dipeptide/oligopeptide/nickel ABC transporter ATP-binding protein [Sutterella sp.]